MSANVRQDDDTLSHNAFFTDETYDFFKLPTELRLKVYNYLMNDIDRTAFDDYDSSSSDSYLSGHSVETLDKADYGPVCGKILYIGDKYSSYVRCEELSSQLLRVCRSIYKEAMESLYKGRTVVTEHFPSLSPRLAEIGNLACENTEEIVLYQTSLPRMRRPSRGSLVEPWPFEDFPLLPPMPALKLITLRYTLSQYQPYHHGRPYDLRIINFVDNLIESSPNPRHFLSEFMTMIEGHDKVRWLVDLCSRHWDRADGQNAEDDDDAKPTRVLIKDVRVFFEIKPVMVERHNVERLEWEIRDVEGGNDEVMVRTTER